MKRIFSFGAGVQTTALVILIKQGKVPKVDAAVFADTGCEKPETYWYMDAYMQPLFKEIGLPLDIVVSDSADKTLYDYCWRIKEIPSPIGHRWCTDRYKIRPIQKKYGSTKVTSYAIGFSLDEANRVDKKRPNKVYPLIEMGLTADDCRHLIKSEGYPLPLKSSCYFCPFQHPVEWNWLKLRRPELFDKALALEARFHEHRPHLRNDFGLLRGTPLWRLKDGIQPEMFQLEGESCWSGYCSH